MKRTAESPGVTAYFNTLQQIFELQANVLTAALPHNAERGRNDEERFREFLVRTLPQRFSVGSGFVVCSEPTLKASSQTDIVIYDEIVNSPLHRELAAFVYPVETVYATVEVKGLLRKKDLPKILSDATKVRGLAEHKWYVQYGVVPKNSGDPSKNVLAIREFKRVKPKPRAYLVAFAQCGWSSIDAFLEGLREALTTTPSHLHGVAVLDANWFLSQKAWESPPTAFVKAEDNALLRLMRQMLHDISSMPMYPMSVDRYLTPLTPNPSINRTARKRAAG